MQLESGRQWGTRRQQKTERQWMTRRYQGHPKWRRQQWLQSGRDAI